MRNIKTLITDIVRKPPLLMPFVAGAHLLGLFWVVWGLRAVPIGNIEWLQAVWMLAYAICWLAACDLRQWGATGYILLSVINVVLYVFIKNPNNRDLYVSNLFILDVLFSLFLLYSSKKFE
jgi:hypothetical protein